MDTIESLLQLVEEIALGQDRSSTQLIDAIGRLEGAIWQVEQVVIPRFATLLEQASIRLTEQDIRSVMEEALDREKRLRKFERGNGRPRPS